MIEAFQNDSLLCSCGNLMKCEYIDMILLKEVPLMTDPTGKNASMNADDCPWTDEKIDEMIAEDTLIKMKHTACGHIDNVPDWIIDEFAEENRMSGKHGEVEIECPVCNGPMRRVR